MRPLQLDQLQGLGMRSRIDIGGYLKGEALRPDDAGVLAIRDSWKSQGCMDKHQDAAFGPRTNKTLTGIVINETKVEHQDRKLV